MRLWEKTQKIYKKNREIERERLPVGGWSDEVALWNKEAEQRGERERGQLAGGAHKVTR